MLFLDILVFLGGVGTLLSSAEIQAKQAAVFLYDSFSLIC